MGTTWLHKEFRLQEQLFSEHKLCPFCVYNVPQEELWRVPLGRELIGIKNGNCTIPGFSDDEVEHLLQFVCAS